MTDKKDAFLITRIAKKTKADLQKEADKNDMGLSEYVRFIIENRTIEID